MALLKVYNGASWDTAEAKVYDGSVWKPKQKFYDGTAWIDLFSAGGTVPSVSDIEVLKSDDTGPNNVAAIFNEATVGAVNNIVKRHVAVYTVMGNDDAATPVDHTGEWTTDSVTGTDWEIAETSNISGTWYLPPAAVGVYVDLSVERSWRVRRAGGKGRTPGTSIAEGNFRLREKADTSNFTDFKIKCTNIQT